MQLFADRGFDGTSTSKIAKEAGLRVGVGLEEGHNALFDPPSVWQIPQSLGHNPPVTKLPAPVEGSQQHTIVPKMATLTVGHASPGVTSRLKSHQSHAAFQHDRDGEVRVPIIECTQTRARGCAAETWICIHASSSGVHACMHDASACMRACTCVTRARVIVCVAGARIYASMGMYV